MLRFLNFFILFLGITLLFYLFYRSLSIQGTFYYYLKFIVLVLFFCLFVFYFIIKKKKYFKEFPLFILSILFSAYLIEILSYTYLRNNNQNYQYKENLFNYYEMNKKKSTNLTIFTRGVIQTKNQEKK